MKNAITWIENNPWEIKHWEVWVKAEGLKAHRIASYKTEESAKKRQVKMIERNKGFYNMAIL